MSASAVLLILPAISAIWAVVPAVMITAALDRHGIRTPFPFIGVLIFRNLIRYRQMTVSETGKVGGLFYSCVIPINTALILAVAALAVRSVE